MYEFNKYKDFTKEQLEIACHNQELMIDKLRDKLNLIKGCPYFGDCDGMNGACVDCSCEDSVLWKQCSKFKKEFYEYRNQR